VPGTARECRHAIRDKRRYTARIEDASIRIGRCRDRYHTVESWRETCTGIVPGGSKNGDMTSHPVRSDGAFLRRGFMAERDGPCSAWPPRYAENRSVEAPEL
jgi:hypothetical protein